jgi:hypothetical protein
VKYIHAHEAVIANEYWYGDRAPFLGKSFSAAKTAQRHADIVDLLQRASRRIAGTGDRRQSRSLTYPSFFGIGRTNPVDPMVFSGMLERLQVQDFVEEVAGRVRTLNSVNKSNI